MQQFIYHEIHNIKMLIDFNIKKPIKKQKKKINDSQKELGENMSLEKFKEKNALEFPLGKLITIIARGHIFYLNHRLEDLNINASQLHTLFEIKCSNGINQDEIAKRCNVDKGSVARSLRKLEDKELIVKEIDKNNRRQNKISLTSKGEYVIEESLKILDDWENEIFKEVDDEEKRVLQEFLKDTAIKTISLNMEIKNSK